MGLEVGDSDTDGAWDSVGEVLGADEADGDGDLVGAAEGFADWEGC